MNTEQADYTVTTLAAAAGVHRTYIARKCKKGEIPARLTGSFYVIRYSDGQAWLAEREAKQAKKS